MHLLMSDVGFESDMSIVYIFYKYEVVLTMQRYLIMRQNHTSYVMSVVLLDLIDACT